MSTDRAHEPGVEAVAAIPAEDPMPLLGVDHLELYVGNATQAAYFFTHAFGFREVAYKAANSRYEPGATSRHWTLAMIPRR